MSTRPSKRLEIHRLSLTFVNRHTCNGNFKGKFGGSIIHDFLLHLRLCVQMRKEEQEDASQNRCLSVEQKKMKIPPIRCHTQYANPCAFQGQAIKLR